MKKPMRGKVPKPEVAPDFELGIADDEGASLRKLVTGKREGGKNDTIPVQDTIAEKPKEKVREKKNRNNLDLHMYNDVIPYYAEGQLRHEIRFHT